MLVMTRDGQHTCTTSKLYSVRVFCSILCLVQQQFLPLKVLRVQLAQDSDLLNCAGCWLPVCPIVTCLLPYCRSCLTSRQTTDSTVLMNGRNSLLLQLLFGGPWFWLLQTMSIACELRRAGAANLRDPAAGNSESTQLAASNLAEISPLSSLRPLP